MADPTPPAAGATAMPTGGQPPAQKPTGKVVIPPEIQQKFGELVALILGSESMNDEERQYWINILPIMTPEQLQNLRDILENERKQLKAIDDKYATEIEQAGQSQMVKKMEEDRHKRLADRQQKESAYTDKEQEKTDAILKEIEGQ